MSPVEEGGIITEQECIDEQTRHPAWRGKVSCATNRWVGMPDGDQATNDSSSASCTFTADELNLSFNWAPEDVADRRCSRPVWGNGLKTVYLARRTRR